MCVGFAAPDEVGPDRAPTFFFFFFQNIFFLFFFFFSFFFSTFFFIFFCFRYKEKEALLSWRNTIPMVYLSVFLSLHVVE